MFKLKINKKTMGLIANKPTSPVILAKSWGYARLPGMRQLYYISKNSAFLDPKSLSPIAGTVRDVLIYSSFYRACLVFVYPLATLYFFQGTSL
jgi:hypothetical protein